MGNTKIIESEAHELKPIFANDQRVLVVMVENANKLFDYVNQGNRENLRNIIQPQIFLKWIWQL